MKAEISEVFAEGAVVRDTHGLEFGLPRGVIAALGHVLADLEDTEVVAEAKATFTHGRPHPLAGLLVPPPELLEVSVKAYSADGFWKEGASEAELAANEGSEGLCVYIGTLGNGETMVSFGISDVDTDGSYAAFYVDLEDSEALSGALLNVDYTDAPSQDAE